MKEEQKIKQAEDIIKIMKEKIESESFFNELVYNIAKGFGESKFVKSIQAVEIEYISGSMTLKAKIQLKGVVETV